MGKPKGATKAKAPGKASKAAKQPAASPVVSPAAAGGPSRASPAQPPIAALAATPVPVKDAFAFDDNELDFGALVRNLERLSSPSKDNILKALKHLSTMLESAPHEVSVLGKHAAALAAALVQPSIVGHADKDVKLYAACCLAYLLRMYAPDTPYDDMQLREVFQLLSWALSRLALPGAPTFRICQTVLQLVEQVKFYLVLVDLDAPELLATFFNALLNAVTDSNAEEVEYSVTECLGGLLEESEGGEGGEVLDQELLPALLLALVGEGEGQAGGSRRRLAQRLLQRCERPLRPLLQRVASQLLAGSCSRKELAARASDILFQLHGAVPQVLLPVLPQLALELESREEGRRSAAAALMVRLLCSPEAEVADHYPDLTKVALQRFKDVAAPIRLQMLDAATRLMADAIPPVQEQVQALATERLSDPDERVRCAALRIVCELGQRPEVSMTRASLNAVAGRLKDVKLSVRKEAASGCMTLFRTAAGLLSKGGLPDELDVSVLAYPARLAAAALSDPELRSHVFVLLHSPGLLPLNTPPAAAARVWAGVWAECEATGRDALLRLLRCKAELAGEVARLLGHTRRLRAASKAPEPDEQQLASFKRRQARSAAAVAELLLGSHATGDSRHKVADQLVKMTEAKDLKVLERLAALADPLQLNEREAREARQDCCERLGSRSQPGTLAASLTAAMAPCLISPACLAALAVLAYPTTNRHPPSSLPGLQSARSPGPASPQQGTAVGGGPGAGDGLGGGVDGVPVALAAAARQLLEVVSQAVPGLCAPAVPHLAGLVVGLAQACALRAVEAEGPPEGEGEEEEEAAAPKRRRAASRPAPKPPPPGPAHASPLGRAAPLLDAPGAAAAAQVWSQLQVGAEVQGLCGALKVLSSCMKSFTEAAGAGAVLAPLPPSLAPAVTQLCLAGPPAAAKASVFVLAALQLLPRTLPHPTSGGQQQPSPGQAPAPGASPGPCSPPPLLPGAVTPSLLRPTAQVNGGAGGGRLLSGAEASREVLGQLAAELVRVIRKGEAGGPAAQAAVHALAAVGCLLPEVVGGVASQLVSFVTDVLLPALQLHLWPTQEGAEAGVAAGDEETTSNPLLLAKAAALRAVARGLTPSVEAGPMPAATVEAVKQLGQVLERLLDVDAEQEVPGCSGEEERGMLRLAAARAVLKLSTRHDSALPPSCYVATALMLQDPVPEPRAVFGAKLRKHVSRLLTMGLVASHAGAPRGGGWLPSKYAAMLALSAVDPVELNKASAARGLREFVVAKRIAANAAAQAAALQPEPLAGSRRKGAAGTGGNIQEQPEFMLPHLLYLLALHPDCPDQEAVCGSQQQDSAVEAGAGDEAQALLAPFVAMLQALLEPLLLAAHAGGSGHTQAGPAVSLRGSGGSGPVSGPARHTGPQAAALLPTLKRVLQSTKVTCLADEDSTAKMRLMCDLGNAVAAAIVTRENTGSPPPAAPPSQVAVVLPRSLFIMDHLAHAPKGRLPDHLPKNFCVALDSEVSRLAMGLPAAPAAEAKAGKRPRPAKIKAESKQAAPAKGKVGVVNGKQGGAGSTKRAKKESKAGDGGRRQPSRRRGQEGDSSSEEEESEESEEGEESEEAEEREEGERGGVGAGKGGKQQAGAGRAVGGSGSNGRQSHVKAGSRDRGRSYEGKEREGLAEEGSGEEEEGEEEEEEEKEATAPSVHRVRSRAPAKGEHQGKASAKEPIKAGSKKAA